MVRASVALDRLNLAQRARVATGLSQRQFAKLLGITPSVVCRWEAGRAPSGAALALLKVVVDHPGIVAATLQNECNSNQLDDSS
jgi:DNA-binding transcriptional regulator YiaG